MAGIGLPAFGLTGVTAHAGRGGQEDLRVVGLRLGPAGGVVAGDAGVGGQHVRAFAPGNRAVVAVHTGVGSGEDFEVRERQFVTRKG